MSNNRSPGRRMVYASAVAAAVGLLVAACSPGGSSSGPPTTVSATSTTTRPASRFVVDGTYAWRQLPIGAGGYVTGVAVSASGEGAMYARTDVGGAYRREPATDRWEQLFTTASIPAGDGTPDDYNVESLALAPSDPSIVYVAVGNDSDPANPAGRIMRSSDGGRHWISSTQRWFISGNGAYRGGTERLAVDPLLADHVLFGSRTQGLWSTLDGGATWSQVASSAIPDGHFADATAEQAGVSFTTFAAPTSATTATAKTFSAFVGVANQGIYGSVDGNSWRPLVPLRAGDYPMGGVVAGGQLFVAIDRLSGSGGRLLRYDIAAGTLQNLSLPTSSQTWQFAVDPGDSNHLVLTDEAVRNGHLWTSIDGGAHWRAHRITISSPQIPWLERTDLADYMGPGRMVFDATVRGRLWLADGMAMWRTDDVDAPTVSWQSHAQGIEETVAAGLVVPPGGAPQAIIADRQGFRFTQIDAYPSSTLIDRRFASGSSIDFSGGHPNVVAWVGAESNIYYSPQRGERGAMSVDGGATWREFDGLTPEMFGGEVAVSATDPNTLIWLPTHFNSTETFRTEPVGLFVSHDGGRSWEHTPSIGSLDSFHRFFWWFTRRALAADRVNADFYLMSDEGAFFVSTDSASTWKRAANAPPCVQQSGCHVVGELAAVPARAGSLLASVGVGGLYRSDDAGATPWVQLPGLTEAGAFGFGAPMPGSAAPTIFVYGKARGDDQSAILRSVDDGASWQTISRAPLASYGQVTSISGDPNVAGRVYVGFNGLGFAVGEPAEATPAA